MALGFRRTAWKARCVASVRASIWCSSGLEEPHACLLGWARGRT